ncbi:MAG: cupin domain-containing protein [Gammaproteobacteria bacterium]|nr:cupin domain-containing protein [Gammaproteobacteria bacterium]
MMNENGRHRAYVGRKSEWAARVANNAPSEWLVALHSNDCLVEYWEPRSVDNQMPHDRDEIYVIVAGDGVLELHGDIRPVAAGDLIFVPASMPHCFVRHSPDLAMWIVFFGPRKTTAAISLEPISRVTSDVFPPT